MSGKSCLPADQALSAYPDASGDSCLGGDNRVFTDPAVMGDLHQVVYLGPPADKCGAHGRTVDRGVGADLDVVLYLHVAHLGNLYIGTVLLRSEPEAVGPDDRTAVYGDPVADDGAVIAGDQRKEDTVASYGNVVHEYRVLADHRIVADSAALTDDGMLADRNVASETGGRGYRCRGIDAGQGDLP